MNRPSQRVSQREGCYCSIALTPSCYTEKVCHSLTGPQTTERHKPTASLKTRSSCTVCCICVSLHFTTAISYQGMLSLHDYDTLFRFLQCVELFKNISKIRSGQVSATAVCSALIMLSHTDACTTPQHTGMLCTSW